MKLVFVNFDSRSLEVCVLMRILVNTQMRHFWTLGFEVSDWRSCGLFVIWVLLENPRF